MERRNIDRAETDLGSACRIPTKPFLATIRNISTTGCLVQADGNHLCRGTTILIGLADCKEVAGEVVWQSGDEFGVRFTRPISTEEVARVSSAGTMLNEALN